MMLILHVFADSSPISIACMHCRNLWYIHVQSDVRQILLTAGIWNEHKALRDRLSRLWRQYDENKPTVTANWDRTAKREPKPPPQPIPKPKVKPKVKPTVKQKPAETDLPEVVFVTPPVTPPPPPPEKVKPKADFKRDDEFWDFYNKA